MQNHKLAVFVSGGGSNLQAIIDAIDNGTIENAEISLVVASKENIYAIDRAKKANIPVSIYRKQDYSNLDNMFEHIIEQLQSFEVDYIVLAGYLLILTDSIINQYRNRIINIHPSLIPNFCGDGFYGMKIHKAVIESKEDWSGATVHFVDEGIDTGKIILQDKVAVYDTDTPESLSARVLELEHRLLPQAINKVLQASKL